MNSNEGFPLGVVPDVAGLTAEERHFRHGDISPCHPAIYAIGAQKFQEKDAIGARPTTDLLASPHEPTVRANARPMTGSTICWFFKDYGNPGCCSSGWAG